MSSTRSLAEGLHGVEFVAPVDRLGALVREVRGLLGGEPMSSPVLGRSRPLKLAVRPEAEIPVYLAALGPRSVRLCGQVADGWLPFCCRVRVCRRASISSARASMEETQSSPETSMSRAGPRGLRRSCRGAGDRVVVGCLLSPQHGPALP